MRKISNLILIVLFLSSLNPLCVLAQSEIEFKVKHISQKDLTGDGLPDITNILCSFASESDLIVVYDGGQDMLWGDDIKYITDFDNDTWIFDANGDGSVELIIEFTSDEASKTALIYDLQGDNSSINYKLVDNKVVVIDQNDIVLPDNFKQQNWHIKIVAPGNWTLPDGQVNPNLYISIDGYIQRFLEWGEAQPSLTWAKENWITDGVVDWEIEIVDTTMDGIPDYQLQRLVNEAPQLSSVFKTSLYVNKNDFQPSSYQNSIIWPILVSKHSYESYKYFQHSPVIAIDWDKGKIDRAGILGYPTESGYHINGREYIEKGKVNYLSFENPMAYYDLANDQDGAPELLARFEVFRAYDPLFPHGDFAGQVPNPVVQVDYSWDQTNNGRWDYKVDLSSQLKVENVVEFPDFSILSIAYEEIPKWVKSNQWDAALFIEAANGGELNSEGIAPWNVNRGYVNGELVEPSNLREVFMQGFTDTPPIDQYNDINVNYRGEYNFEYFDTPKIYFSILDRKLHLNNAQSGVWNLGESEYIRYANLDKDAYIDQWVLERNGNVTKQINYCDGFYIFTENNQVFIKESNDSPSVFETSPPGTFDEWTFLKNKLEDNAIDFAPDDFAALFGLIESSQFVIGNGSIHDFRVTETGFRFVLGLSNGFTVAGSEILGVKDLNPGRYVVSYDGAFKIQPVSPVDIKFSIGDLDNQSLKVLKDNAIPVVISNMGLLDAHEIIVSASMQGPSGETILIKDQKVTLLAGENQLLNLPFTPETAGTWQIVLTSKKFDVSGKYLQDQVNQDFSVVVNPALDTTLSQDMTAFGVIQPWQLIAMFTILLLIVLLSAWLFSHQLWIRTIHAPASSHPDEQL